MTIQPARHKCHACCPLQAEKPGIQPVLGNTHGTHVEQVVASFQKILRGSQLTWYVVTTDLRAFSLTHVKKITCVYKNWKKKYKGSLLGMKKREFALLNSHFTVEKPKKRVLRKQ